MALVINLTRRVEIPHEPGHYLDVRMLSWCELKAAKEARQEAVLRNMRAMGGELMRELQGVESEEAEAAANDPLNQYDQGALLRAGIVGWSYDVPVSAEAINQLDEPTAEWAARTILTLHQRTEEDRKNGF